MSRWRLVRALCETSELINEISHVWVIWQRWRQRERERGNVLTSGWRRSVTFESPRCCPSEIWTCHGTCWIWGKFAMYHMLLNAASVGFYLVAARSSDEHCEAGTAAVRRVHEDDSMARWQMLQMFFQGSSGFFQCHVCLSECKCWQYWHHLGIPWHGTFGGTAWMEAITSLDPQKYQDSRSGKDNIVQCRMLQVPKWCVLWTFPAPKSCS